MAIFEVDSGTGAGAVFVISADSVWLPGRYESRRAAKYAFRFCVDLLAELRDESIETNEGTITFEAMQKKYRDRGYKCGKGVHV